LDREDDLECELSGEPGLSLFDLEKDNRGPSRVAGGINSSMAVELHRHIRGMKEEKKRGREDPVMSPRVYCPCEGADLGRLT
jgi:hypothetical protein